MDRIKLTEQQKQQLQQLNSVIKPVTDQLTLASREFNNAIKPLKAEIEKIQAINIELPKGYLEAANTLKIFSEDLKKRFQSEEFKEKVKNWEHINDAKERFYLIKSKAEHYLETELKCELPETFEDFIEELDLETRTNIFIYLTICSKKEFYKLLVDYSNIFKEDIKIYSTGTSNNIITSNKVKSIAHIYLAIGKKESKLSPVEAKKIGNKFYQKLTQLNPFSSAYNPPTIRELNETKNYLESSFPQHPDVLKSIINDVSKGVDWKVIYGEYLRVINS